MPPQTSPWAPLFAWSLVALRVMADVEAPRGSGADVFALALIAFTTTLLWVGRGLRRRSPRGLLGVAAVLAGVGLGLAAAGQRPEIPWVGVGLWYPRRRADRVGPRAFPAVYGRVFTGWGCAGLAAPLFDGTGATDGSARPELYLLLAAPLAVAVAALTSLSYEARSRPCR